MKMYRFYALLLLVFLMAGVPAVAGAKDIVIGYSGPLSGPAAEYGQDCLNGIEMAINEINSRGGIEVAGRRYQFRLEKMDDQVKPEKALANATLMRREHGAIAIFNPVATTIMPLMKANMEKKNEFLIMAYCAVPQVSEMGNRLIVTLTSSFTTYAKIAAQEAWEKGWRKCAVVVTAGAYGDAWRQVFGMEWLKKGGTITVDLAANYYTRTDFAVPLQQALASDPDFLLIGGPSATTALIVEQSRVRGFEGGFVMIDQAKLDDVVPIMQKPLGLEGTIGVAMVRDIGVPASQEFINNYRQQYKRNANWESVINYTGMYALSRAMVLAGTTSDAFAIRAAMTRVFPMLGDKYPTEIFAISPGGRFIMPAVVQTMRHGRFTSPNTYVWWAATEKEFEAVRKLTTINPARMMWKKDN
ncbi:MAG: ABC transporter substrate-binding protein [Smithellaceae bacterium]|jgi:branched-chain amino acid transport system substrate-binding protein